MNQGFIFCKKVWCIDILNVNLEQKEVTWCSYIYTKMHSVWITRLLVALTSRIFCGVSHISCIFRMPCHVKSSSTCYTLHFLNAKMQSVSFMPSCTWQRSKNSTSLTLQTLSIVYIIFIPLPCVLHFETLERDLCERPLWTKQKQ